MNRLGKFLTLIRHNTVWGLVFLSTHVYAQNSPIKPDLERGRAIAQQVCAACHGLAGNALNNAYPQLAGQHADYLLKQLTDYKTAGTSPPTRDNPIMAGFAAALSESDAQHVAAYFAAQKPAAGVAHEPQKVALGEKIWRGGLADKGVPACAACHGPAGAGIPTQYPRLAGQPQTYTIAQMNAFAQGSRTNSAPMQAIAERLSTVEIQAIADYIAGLR